MNQATIEEVASFWNRRPCNVRHSPKPRGTREYFEEVEARKYFVEPHIPRFAKFDEWKGKTVLEIGCGLGTDTVHFARAGARVTAVDISDQSLELARKHVDVFGLSDRVSFYHADAEKLTDVISPQPFDLVYSFGVIHHTPNPERVIQQIRENYVEPASVLKLMVYYRYAYKVIMILLKEGRGAFWRLDELVARHSEAQTGSPVTYLYSRRQMRHLLEGFRIEEMGVEHIFPYRVAEYKNYRYVKSWPFNFLSSGVTRWIESVLGWHLCVTARPCASNDSRASASF
ncbi:MAG: class I SAM-dependent methyltransferase [Candidatus Omnitrophota bacterium]|nr:class I SAM-dependent methyltransferase [Candidatus Omnitrophota bacterium]